MLGEIAPLLRITTRKGRNKYRFFPIFFEKPCKALWALARRGQLVVFYRN